MSPAMLPIRPVVAQAMIRLMSRIVSIVDSQRWAQIFSCMVMAEVAAWAMSRAFWSITGVFMLNAHNLLRFHGLYDFGKLHGLYQSSMGLVEKSAR